MKEKVLRTKLCDMLGCDYPICLAGMGLGTYLGGKDGRAIVSGSELTAAVSNAGGFGTLACTGLTLDMLRDEIKRTKKLTDKPFGVDLMFPATEAGEIIRKMKEELVGGKYKEHTDFVEKLAQKLGVTSKLDWEDILNLTMWDPDFCRAQAEIVFEEGADAFCLGTGSPKWVIDKAHDCGMKVISLVGTVRQAAAVKEAGADIIVAQGYDAGGHTGDIGTFSLIPQVVDAVSLTPVLAAGGIFDGRGIAAALSFGAVGVWVGTAFEATVEANISEQQKQNIIAATERDPRKTRVFTGKTMRHTLSIIDKEWSASGMSTLPMPLQNYLITPLMKEMARMGREDVLMTPAGQGAGGIKEIKTAKQVLDDMVSQAIDILTYKLPNLVEL